MRGEHLNAVAGGNADTGSSPHARGAPDLLVGRKPQARDHPRMRGEHKYKGELLYKVKGSSPHARGALHDRIPESLVCGIIPACAGSTRDAQFCKGKRGDHPRMRGEHSANHPAAPLMPGSSPHARGARFPAVLRHRPPGIIPACAGSTLKYLVII